MSDFISRNALIERLCESKETNWSPSYVLKVIKHQPAVCKVEVHGEWIFKIEGTYNSRRAYCSVCGKRSGIGGNKENQMKPYCPNCGAKMCLSDKRSE